MTETGTSRPAAQIGNDGTLHVRASAAMQCRRALWYAAMGHEQVVKPDADTLMMWDTGNTLETVVVRAMRRDGWKVNRRTIILSF